MICLDTNIVIYIASGRLGESLVGDQPIFYPSILRIEALGYHNIRSVEERRIKELLAALTELPLTNAIIEHATRLRQQSKMSLGDAIVAASAIEHGCTLWTANIKDFSHIDGLQVHDPLNP
jgi:predicted nucleic acid-binding protein